MKTLKKLLTFALIFALCISLVPSVAFAADPPELQSATVTSDGHVELTFDKAMAAPPVGDAGFSVTGMFGQNKNVQSATLHPSDNTKIILTLGITIKGGESGGYPWGYYTPGTVQSADGEPLADIAGFSIDNPLPHPTLGTTPLPDGTVGTPYTYTFTATGGTSPYSFYKLYGDLPPGLSLNNSTGELSGTPTASGTYGDSTVLRIEVLDANQALDIRNIIIVINAASSISLPIVVTNAVMGVTTTGATLLGEMTDDGGATDTERGFVYAQNANPTTADTKVVVGSGEGSFSTALSGIASGTTYHVRAYATNSAGTSYGVDRTFTTEHSSGGGSSTPTYYNRTLTDSSTGITVSGTIHRDAALTVKNTGLHAAGTCAACDAIRAHMADRDFVTLTDKDISLSLGFNGSLAVRIPVGSAYNGETVTILHCANGMLKTYAATVQDGKATFTVTSLSPFAVFANADELDNIPKTGDGDGFPLWLSLMASGLLLGSLSLLWRRSKRA